MMKRVRLAMALLALIGALAPSVGLAATPTPSAEPTVTAQHYLLVPKTGSVDTQLTGTCGTVDFYILHFPGPQTSTFLIRVNSLLGNILWVDWQAPWNRITIALPPGFASGEAQDVIFVNATSASDDKIVTTGDGFIFAVLIGDAVLVSPFFGVADCEFIPNPAFAD